jgi:hypothetical protein
MQWLVRPLPAAGWRRGLTTRHRSRGVIRAGFPALCPRTPNNESRSSAGRILGAAFPHCSMMTRPNDHSFTYPMSVRRSPTLDEPVPSPSAHVSGGKGFTWPARSPPLIYVNNIQHFSQIHIKHRYSKETIGYVCDARDDVDRMLSIEYNSISLDGLVNASSV